MKVSHQKKRNQRLQNILFFVLLLVFTGLLALLSSRYYFHSDWSANGRNSLSQASISLLSELQGKIKITAYARQTPLIRKRISELVKRYQQYNKNIELIFINPDLEPQLIRELNISVDGELHVDYLGRSEKLVNLTEHGLTNALLRLGRSGPRHLILLQGHGERGADSDASYGLSAWKRHLEAKGVTVSQINLAMQKSIPEDGAVLMIASPQTDLLPGEVQFITSYIDRGGSILWLADPDQQSALVPVAENLGLEFKPGIVIDPNVSQVGMNLFGSNDPRIALVATYPEHEILRDFDLNTMFPVAGGLELKHTGEWQQDVILKTLSNTWLETGNVQGNIIFDDDSDISGPINIGVALSRSRVPSGGNANVKGIQEDDIEKMDSEIQEDNQQRIIVVADGDFLSNGFIGVGGNLQLGMNIINWIFSDENFISIPARTSIDQSLNMSDIDIAVVSFGFLLVLPAGLAGAGVWVWKKRRN